MDRLERAVIVIICAACVIASVVMLSGCAGFGMDNTASGGGKWGFETYHPCLGPSVDKPIGGNAGNVQNTSTDGGSTRADR